MKILVVDDDQLIHLTLKTIFKDEQLTLASNLAEAEKILESESFNVAFLDIQLEKGPALQGIDLLRRIRQRDCYLPCVMISGLDDKEIITKCFELGAVDYVVKGVAPPENYRLALLKAAIWRKLLSESDDAREPEKRPLNGLDFIAGRSAAIQELKRQIQRVGSLPGPFLILGETGTGKELVAKAIWTLRGDLNRPFIPVNCASLPHDLIESELFGYERGAFTGALTVKTGLFEAANGGDILLDEIGELSADLQAKFLRVLQERKVRRLGSDRERPVDVRVIAATNVNLLEAVQDKEFREDLFYRLNVHVIKVPPLRERREDLPILIEFFLKEIGYKQIEFDEQARSQIVSFSWPGNVRQLRAFVEYLRGYLNSDRAVITARHFDGWLENNQLGVRGEIRLPHGADPESEVQAAFQARKGIDLVTKLDSLQRAYVEAAVKVTQNNRTQAARLLGVSRQRLSNWLTDWGVF